MKLKNFKLLNFIAYISLCLYGTIVLGNTAKADIAVIVNVKNQTVWDDSSPSQIKDIFLGKREKFPDGESAKPVDQRNGSTRKSFYLNVTGKDESALNVYWSNLIFTGNGQPPKVVGDDEDVKRMVKENPNAIGYIDSHYVDSTVKVIYTIK